jgi:hypothetical protein
MGTTTYFRINTPKIVNETIDGEVVIINFDSGNYYSSDTLGCEIWTLIEQRHSVDDIIQTVKERYSSDKLDLEESVRAFLGELELEQLVVSTKEGATSAPSLPERSDKQTVSEPPKLHKFKDMQELLLLDPIHDVDDAGWPAAKREEE